MKHWLQVILLWQRWIVKTKMYGDFGDIIQHTHKQRIPFNNSYRVWILRNRSAVWVVCVCVLVRIVLCDDFEKSSKILRNANECVHNTYMNAYGKETNWRAFVRIIAKTEWCSLNYSVWHFRFILVWFAIESCLSSISSEVIILTISFCDFFYCIRNGCKEKPCNKE